MAGLYHRCRCNHYSAVSHVPISLVTTSSIPYGCREVLYDGLHMVLWGSLSYLGIDIFESKTVIRYITAQAAKTVNLLVPKESVRYCQRSTVLEE